MADRLLSAVVATGRGASKTFDMAKQPPDKFAIQIDFDDSDTAITALVVTLDTTLDLDATDATANWFPHTTITLTSDELTANGTIRWIDGKIAQRVAGNITTLTGGGSGNPINVTVISSRARG
jgi:hypothetical protein